MVERVGRMLLPRSVT